MLFRIAPVALALATAVIPSAQPPGGLPPATVTAWEGYVTTTEGRIRGELTSPRGFLSLDFLPSAAQERRMLAAGGVVVAQIDPLNARGEALEIPDAMAHHWRGAVLIPGITVANLLSQLQSGAPPTKQEDVLKSVVLERGPDRMKVYLRVQRSKIVTVVFNTEHVITFTRYGTMRASSTSTATKIAELENPGTPQERELPPGQDRGFMWRLNSYWRYEQVPGGVIAECESLTLSRPIPWLLTYLVRPIVNSTASESMWRTLDALRSRFGGRASSKLPTF